MQVEEEQTCGRAAQPLRVKHVYPWSATVFQLRTAGIDGVGYVFLHTPLPVRHVYRWIATVFQG